MRLEQVLVNLLSNAVKYTPPGGAIAVTVMEEGDAVAVAVCDTGIGLEKEQLQQIFEPFVQFGEEGGGGLGIGLTLVKQLIDLHGGTVGVESLGRNRGSTFRIALPRADGTEETAEAGCAAEPSMETGLRVLIVDDNADSADMLGLLLRLRGLDVVTVHSGRAVEAAVARHDPELVLLDLGLPDLSGYDVARLLRDAGHERMVIVALTGFSHDDARERVRRAGFDAHVVKPISLAQVGELMAEFQDRLG
jgi:CheY-like chemotaxis protein